MEINKVYQGDCLEVMKDFNSGTAMWKGKMLMDMTRLELYEAINTLGGLYERELRNKLNEQNSNNKQ
jgi:predicted transcriptional regulator